MAQTVRCKFRCNEVIKRFVQPHDQPSYYTYAYKFSPVYSDTPENKKFFDATPFGGLEVGAFRDDLFMPGKEYYLDISEAIG